MKPHWEIRAMYPNKRQRLGRERLCLLICRVKHQSQSTVQIITKWLGFCSSLCFSQNWPISAAISQAKGSRVINFNPSDSLFYFLPFSNKLACNGAFCVHRSTHPDDSVTAPAHLTIGSTSAALFAEHSANLDRTAKTQSDSKHHPDDARSDAQSGTRHRVQVFRSQNTVR